MASFGTVEIKMDPETLLALDNFASEVKMLREQLEITPLTGELLVVECPEGKTPLELAVMFHDTYERLAPDYGYETRPETRLFDPETSNGRLMVAVCGEIIAILGS